MALPFMASGSTGRAAVLEGVDYVGIGDALIARGADRQAVCTHALLQLGLRP
jgi:hypothetical protein